MKRRRSVFSTIRRRHIDNWSEATVDFGHGSLYRIVFNFADALGNWIKAQCASKKHYRNVIIQFMNDLRMFYFFLNFCMNLTLGLSMSHQWLNLILDQFCLQKVFRKIKLAEVKIGVAKHSVIQEATSLHFKQSRRIWLPYWIFWFLYKSPNSGGSPRHREGQSLNLSQTLIWTRL